MIINLSLFKTKSKAMNDTSNDLLLTFLSSIKTIKSTEQSCELHASLIETKLGQMIAIADKKALYVVDFIDSRRLKRKIEKLCQILQAHIVVGSTDILQLVNKELNAYFAGHLAVFTTPINFVGSSFQN